MKTKRMITGILAAVVAIAMIGMFFFTITEKKSKRNEIAVESNSSSVADKADDSDNNNDTDAAENDKEIQVGDNTADNTDSTDNNENADSDDTADNNGDLNDKNDETPDEPEKVEIADKDDEIDDDFVDSFITGNVGGDQGILGVFEFMNDIHSMFRGNDPEIPSYLTCTYNPNFCIKLSEEEIYLLCKLVAAEAPAEDIYGKILVANVVLNRVLSNGWPKTVAGVIFERSVYAVQFESTAIGWYWDSVVVTDKDREAVTRALMGEDYSDGALFFYAWAKMPSDYATNSWISVYENLFTHGGHTFFR